VEIIYNGEPRAIPPGTTVASLLKDLDLPPRLVAVELNKQVVTRTAHEACQLTDGDRLEIVTLVGGG